MALGASILFYVGTQYWEMYAEQRRLVSKWEQQQKAPAQAATPAVLDEGLARIWIPRINLNAIIVEGTSHKALLVGPGHLPETPVPGTQGNSVISAHRDTFFRHIYELNKGDVITVQRNGRSYDYEVTGKKIVDPSDLSVIRPSSDARLTLITCYPTYYIGPAPERLVVFTKLVPDNQAKLAGAPAERELSAPRR